MKLLHLAFGAVLAGTSAQAQPLLCSAAELRGDSSIREAVAAVFPKSQSRSKTDDCANPLQLLRYGDADVLLTTKGPPDDFGCHGCAAVLSAFVLRRTPEGPKLIASFLDVAELGSHKSAGDIHAIQLAGHDAFAAESGGTFQGYTNTLLSFFVFRDGRLDQIKPDLPFAATNDGAASDEAKVVTIDGAWHIDADRPDLVTVDYLAKAAGQRRRSSASWALEHKSFKLVSGRVPAEYASASGRE